MNPVVQGMLAAGHGLITRPQAIDAGLTAREIDRLVRTGLWVAVRRGVYAEAAHWADLDEYVGKARLRARAVSLTMRQPHVLSHESAAHELGLPVLGGRDHPVHVTHARGRGARTENGVKHHLAAYSEEQVVMVEGLRVLGVARTAVDIARDHGLTHGAVACDSALRFGVTRADLRAVRETMWCWPGASSIDRAIAFADAAAESVAETLGRLFVAELGIGAPELQFTLVDGSTVTRCDMRVGRHIFEVDGRVKYLPIEQRGLARKPPGEILWDEKLRQDFVCGFKLGMSRLVWADFWGAQRRAALRRVRREYDDTVARFGSDISDLAPYVWRP